MSTVIAPEVIAPSPRPLLADPLEWFLAEHYRHRQFCRMLADAADAPDFQPDTLRMLADFIRHDMAPHIADEEEDLFPLLRRRALPGDELDRVLALLAEEHRGDIVQATDILAQLEACLTARRPPGADPAVRRAFLDFASRELRHLALENAVVLPIARLRLSGRDLAGLSRRLAARRGVKL